jgi:hypothetical protein
MPMSIYKKHTCLPTPRGGGNTKNAESFCPKDAATGIKKVSRCSLCPQLYYLRISTTESSEGTEEIIYEDINRNINKIQCFPCPLW